MVLPERQPNFILDYSNNKETKLLVLDSDEAHTSYEKEAVEIYIPKDFSYKYSEQLKEVFNIDNQINLKGGNIYKINGGRACGKTTLAKLLVGEISSNGKILVKHGSQSERSDKSNLANIKCSYLNESNSFFPGPLSDSITFFGQLDNIEDYTNLVKTLGFDDIIDKIPGKLSYKLNASGSNISARTLTILEIVRSILEMPDIIIFDYALDSLEQDYIVRILEYLRNKKSIVILISRVSIDIDSTSIFLSKKEEK